MPAQVSRLKSASAPREARFVLPDRILPGPRFLAMVLTALPAAVVGFAATGSADRISGLIAAAWYGLIPGALYSRWVAFLLPVVATGFLVLTVLALPFNSAAFVVDFWTSAAMLLLSLPKRQ